MHTHAKQRRMRKNLGKLLEGSSDTPGMLLGSSCAAAAHTTPGENQQAPPNHTQHARMTPLDPLADLLCGPHENE